MSLSFFESFHDVVINGSKLIVLLQQVTQLLAHPVGPTVTMVSNMTHFLSFNSSIFHIIGVILGNPASPTRVRLTDIQSAAVMHAENISANAKKLAVNLLSVLFSHEELAVGNCTKPVREDIMLLDPEKIRGIRGTTFYSILCWQILSFLLAFSTQACI